MVLLLPHPLFPSLPLALGHLRASGYGPYASNFLLYEKSLVSTSGRSLRGAWVQSLPKRFGMAAYMNGAELDCLPSLANGGGEEGEVGRVSCGVEDFGAGRGGRGEEWRLRDGRLMLSVAVVDQ